MKIISLQASNVKKLVAVEIRPDGNVVEICGKNGQGKTSVLDSIWWALAGTKHIQAAPIRKGADEARIRLDLGEIVVSRRFWKSKTGEDESSITVENADGARYPSPQKMLDALLGELSFDPLAFARMDAKGQFNALRRFVPEIDFEQLANAERGDRERRTELNRLASQERAAAAVITVPTDTPEDLVDEAALVDELNEAGAKNADTERRRGNRKMVEAKIEQLRQDADAITAGIEPALEQLLATRQTTISKLEEQIEDIKRQIDRVRLQYNVDHAALVKERKASALTARNEANALEEKLHAAGDLPETIDTAVITARINQARTTNASVRRLIERTRHEAAAKNLEGQSAELTRKIEERQAGKVAVIAAAKMPVEGIGFGDQEVLLNKLPFEQASDAEQLRASVAIAMALNPKLRVIRIRDGSLLDTDAMQLLAEMAAKHDMQVWIERVDGSGKVGFVLEDGHVRRAAVAEPAKAQEATA